MHFFPRLATCRIPNDALLQMTVAAPMLGRCPISLGAGFLLRSVPHRSSQSPLIDDLIC
jgi:hypothetical protein